MYIKIAFTLQFDDIGVVPGLLPFFPRDSKVMYVVKKTEWRRPGNESRLALYNFFLSALMMVIFYSHY